MNRVLDRTTTNMHLPFVKMSALFLSYRNTKLFKKAKLFQYKLFLTKINEAFLNLGPFHGSFVRENL